MTYHDDTVELPLELRPPIVVERPSGSGTFVRLNDSYLRSIVYIGCKHPDSETLIDAHGTGFLVVHEGHTYIVTAAHVAVDFLDAPVDIRLNKRDDGLGGIEHIDNAEWCLHPDDTVDVAVLPFVVPIWARVCYLKSKAFATEYKVESKDFGAGDLAYVVGMFSKMHGTHANIPFVHTGHIASMGRDDELVETEDWRPGSSHDATLFTRGYLVQTTTIEGSSGSPVFVRRTLEVAGGILEKNPRTGNPEPVRAWTYGSVWLLGLWHGAWSPANPQKIIVGDDMGLCVPVPRILEVLDRKELKDKRQAADQAKRAASMIVMQPQSRRRKALNSGDKILVAALNTSPIQKSKAKRPKRARTGVSSK